METNLEATAGWWVICLCAQWCGVCREWQEAFDEAAASHPGLRFAWVDVEDEAEAMGDLDIETFPTLLIARNGSPVFFGPVPPSPSQLSRLVSSMVNASVPAATASADATQLLQRLVTSVLPKT